jgi:hypothetical protein
MDKVLLTYEQVENLVQLGIRNGNELAVIKMLLQILKDNWPARPSGEVTS